MDHLSTLGTSGSDQEDDNERSGSSKESDPGSGEDPASGLLNNQDDVFDATALKKNTGENKPTQFENDDDDDLDIIRAPTVEDSQSYLVDVVSPEETFPIGEDDFHQSRTAC